MRYLRTLSLALLAVLLVLPPAGAYADIAEFTWTQPGARSDYIAAVDASSDLQYGLAVGYQQMFASDDYGQTWTSRNIPETDDWYDVDALADGSRFYGIKWGDISSQYELHYTTDLGVTWTPVASVNFPAQASKLSISADGSKLVTFDQNDIYMSEDEGVNWTTLADVAGTWYYNDVQISQNGQVLTAIGNSTFFTSVDGGTTWNQIAGTPVQSSWRRTLTMSADGSKMMVAGTTAGYPLYTSTDYGSTWTLQSDVASPVGGVNRVVVVEISEAGDKWVVGRQHGDYHVSADGSTWTTESYTQKQDWEHVVATPDLSSMIGIGNYLNFYTSTNEGRTWTMQLFNQARAWSQLASSTDGQRLVVGDFDGSLWTSSDAGATWQERIPNTNFDWYGTAISGDGQHIVGVQYNGYIYVSNDFGATWTEQTAAGQRNWAKVGISDDGQTIAVATQFGDGLYITNDGGTTWNQRTASGVSLYHAAVSADGQTIMSATHDTETVYLSNDGGATWTPVFTDPANGGGFENMAMSADASVLAVIDFSTAGRIYISRDGGSSWSIETVSTNNRDWSSVSISNDGQTIVGGVYGEHAFYSQDAGVTWAEMTDFTSSNWWWTATTISGDASRLYLAAYNDPIFIGVLGAATEEPVDEPDPEPVVGNDADTIENLETTDGMSELADTGVSLHAIALLATLLAAMGLFGLRRLINISR